MHSKQRIPSYYCNLKRWLPIHEAYEAGKPSYYCTPAVNTIVALESALRVIFQLNRFDQLPSLQTARDILTKRWKDHEVAANEFRQHVKQCGLKLVAHSDHIAANTLSAIYAPPSGVATVVQNAKSNGFMIAGGLLKEIDPYFRVGHMGQSIYLGHVLKFASLLPKLLK